MGNFASDFKDTKGYDVTEESHPSKDNWITEHAQATGCKSHIVANFSIPKKLLNSPM